MNFIFVSFQGTSKWTMEEFDRLLIFDKRVVHQTIDSSRMNIKCSIRDQIDLSFIFDVYFGWWNKIILQLSFWIMNFWCSSKVNNPYLDIFFEFQNFMIQLDVHFGWIFQRDECRMNFIFVSFQGSSKWTMKEFDELNERVKAT